MVIKWIRCTVTEHTRVVFSKTQQKWKPITHSSGFVAQFGGWDVKNVSVAHIFGIWKDTNTLNQFMKNDHDAIFEASNQKGTYDAIDISFYNAYFSMEVFVQTLLQNSYLNIVASKNNNTEWIFTSNNSEESFEFFLDNTVKIGSIYSIQLLPTWTILS